MDDSKPQNNDPKFNPNEENPNFSSSPAVSAESNDVAAMNLGEEDNNNNNNNGTNNNGGRQNRTPFTELSQVDADLALARTLQEQASLSLSLSLVLVCVCTVTRYDN